MVFVFFKAKFQRAVCNEDVNQGKYSFFVISPVEMNCLTTTKSLFKNQKQHKSHLKKTFQLFIM